MLRRHNTPTKDKEALLRKTSFFCARFRAAPSIVEKEKQAGNTAGEDRIGLAGQTGETTGGGPATDLAASVMGQRGILQRSLRQNLAGGGDEPEQPLLQPLLQLLRRSCGGPAAVLRRTRSPRASSCPPPSTSRKAALPKENGLFSGMAGLLSC